MTRSFAILALLTFVAPAARAADDVKPALSTFQPREVYGGEGRIDLRQRDTANARKKALSAETKNVSPGDAAKAKELDREKRRERRAERAG